MKKKIHQLKNRARLEILNYLTMNLISRNYGDGVNRGGFDGNYFEPKERPELGDLVSLRGAPTSKWYLSWYVDFYLRGDMFSHQHGLESIETGEMCNWCNVSFYALNRKIVDEHPSWRWTDRQFQFSDRWFRACFRKRRAHLTLPMSPEFKSDGSAVLGVRRRYGFGDEPKHKVLDNWKKVLVKDMLEFYDSVSWGKKETRER